MYLYVYILLWGACVYVYVFVGTLQVETKGQPLLLFLMSCPHDFFLRQIPRSGIWNTLI